MTIAKLIDILDEYYDENEVHFMIAETPEGPFRPVKLIANGRDTESNTCYFYFG